MFRALPFLERLKTAGGSFSIAERGLHVALVGAGGIHFGTPEGPWNHSARLEKLGVSFSAVVDPNVELAQARIDRRRETSNFAPWKDTRALASYKDLLEDPAVRPDAVFIGIPASCHGSLHDPAARIELDLARAGVPFFVDKPLSLRPPAEVRQLAAELERLQEEKGLVMSVGYMLRYSPAVVMAKKLLEAVGRPPTAIVARYAGAYSEIRKKEFWDVSQSGGPVVEQGTHFLDLMRHFGGEVQQETLQGIAVGPELKLRDMPEAPEGEHSVPQECRINRVSAATFQFESGAVGSFTHSIVLNGSAFFTELEIYADGLHMIIGDPYAHATLRVRYPLNDDYQEVALDQKVDMYYEELSAFVKAVRSGDSSDIKSSYADAAKTYELSQCVASRCKPSMPQKS